MKHAVLLTALCFACNAGRAPAPAEAPQPVDPAPEPAAAPAAPVAPATPAAPQRETVTLDPADLTWDDEAGTATWSPGSRVKAAAYMHTVFEAAALEAALGGRPDAPVELRIEILSSRTEASVPEDPNVAAPEGGFAITTRQARPVAD